MDGGVFGGVERIGDPHASHPPNSFPGRVGDDSSGSCDGGSSDYVATDRTLKAIAGEHYFGYTYRIVTDVVALETTQKRCRTGLNK